MPQFDFYSWYSVCFYTLIFFHLSYFLFLRYIFLPLIELAKIRQKLVSLVSNNKQMPSLFESFLSSAY
jgi:hypothetical protein